MYCILGVDTLLQLDLQRSLLARADLLWQELALTESDVTPGAPFILKHSYILVHART